MSLLLLLLTGVKTLGIEPHTQWFRLKSSADSPAGMTHPLHVRFANGVELIGYDLSRTEARQGGELRVRLYWRTHQSLAEDVRSFVHLNAPVTQETWANVTKDLAGEIPSSRVAARFLRRRRFSPCDSGDVPPVRAELTVGLIGRAEKRLALADGGDQVSLGQVSLLNAPKLPSVAQLFARFSGR